MVNDGVGWLRHPGGRGRDTRRSGEGNVVDQMRTAMVAFGMVCHLGSACGPVEPTDVVDRGPIVRDTDDIGAADTDTPPDDTDDEVFDPDDEDRDGFVRDVDCDDDKDSAVI